MALVVRTWNVFHGNASPPERGGFLPEAVRLAVADDPDVVCLQEVPVWALPRLAGWSGYAAATAIAAPPRLGPLRWPAEAGRLLTELDHGRFRSFATGQGNAILVAPRHRVVEERTLVLNPRAFRRREGRRLGLDLAARLAWAKERRVCQAARLETADGPVLVANLHATSFPADERVPDAELRRAAVFLEALARPGERLVLCGDANVVAARSATLRDLAAAGWSAPAPGIDQVLVRGAAARPEAWPQERRRVGSRLLSDHAPVEAVLA
ncbi:MAG TPA: endonuclease/exonuclease/phosphatase family protein [Gaiellaceae bacterium]|nr:endonuclease/exonuclease/phosphatase family protein [Gaiellaceae bacterium]